MNKIKMQRERAAGSQQQQKRPLLLDARCGYIYDNIIIRQSGVCARCQQNRSIGRSDACVVATLLLLLGPAGVDVRRDANFSDPTHTPSSQTFRLSIASFVAVPESDRKIDENGWRGTEKRRGQRAIEETRFNC